MAMPAVRLFARLCSLVLLLVCGCGTNIEVISKMTLPPVPDAVVFEAPLDRVWSAAAAALKAEGTIKLLDRASTTMVTELHPVDSQELSLIDKALAGKTYRNGYSLSFRAQGSDKTEVSVLVSMEVTQFGITRREDGQPHVKSVLRQRLFDRIAVNLGR